MMKMKQPPIWQQMKIPEHRMPVISAEVNSVIRTKEPIGIMLTMIRDTQKIDENEKLYAAFLIAKESLMQDMMNAMPAIGKPLVRKALEE